MHLLQHLFSTGLKWLSRLSSIGKIVVVVRENHVRGYGNMIFLHCYSVSSFPFPSFEPAWNQRVTRPILLQPFLMSECLRPPMAPLKLSTVT